MKDAEKMRMNLLHISDMGVRRAISAINLTDAEVKTLLASDEFARLQQESTRENVMKIVRRQELPRGAHINRGPVHRI